MSQTDAPSASPAGNESEPYRLDEWRMRLLERAAESAVAVLEKITGDVQTGEVTTEGDLGLTYWRIAKALRQSLALHAKFEEDSHKSQQERAAEAAARQAAEAQRAAAIRANGRSHQKRQVNQAIKVAMEAEDQEHFDYSAARRELFERLDDFDDYSDFGRKPVGEIVEGICKILGLKFDPALWEHEPWAIAEAKAKAAATSAAAPPHAAPPHADRPDTANDDEDHDADDEETDPFGIATGTGPP